MTKTLPNSPQDGNRSRKRILKPVVEKKRRDRINHSLAELRSLLLNSTSDPRLQNPKIEKAEILDLAVEYLHKWTSGANDAVQIRHTPVSPPRLEPSSVFTMETAGFKQCMAELTSYIHKITPAQRSSLIEGLKRHTDTHPPSLNHELEQRLGHVPSSLDSSYSSSDKKEDSLKFPFLSHSFNHSPHCSTPLHDYLSPPLSPWLSPLSGYSTSPPFVTYACHFTFPPTPPSCNSSLSTLPAPVPFTPTPGVYLPLQPPPRGACSSSASVWRPW
ncbi:hairy-related 11 [Boleophthalmus pectinirostris]|uniref:hairy-related 11 n=1 Tax=Boleophthalmus pectinirostris TaxID=150288 RepID=UPI000A1C62A1|nr:hairy-related 11 [Boleophthalmus pectinirostris]XP_055015448.1 hairy-related 11 [Boleophthalmus pectinirostris]